MHRVKTHRVSRSIGGNLLVFLFLTILGIFMLIPFLYVVNNAFKPIEELLRFPPSIFVQNPTLVNFTNLFNLLSETSMPFLRYVFNTVLVTVVGAVGQIVLASLCAYSLSKIPFPGSKAIFKVIVFSLMFSTVVTQVPNYIIFAKLKIIDTFAAMLIPTLVTTLGLYLMKQFMESTVPDALLEAGRIDGASELAIFFRIVMPLLKPAWMTLIILSIQSLWNSQSVYTYSEAYKTMPQALAQIVTGGIERTGVSAAISLFMLIVPLFCFLIMQSNIIDTMSSSGLKG